MNRARVFAIGLTLVAGIAWHEPSRAMTCLGGGGLQFWPSEGSSVPTNARVVVTGHYECSPALQELTNASLRLRGPEGEIRLRRTETYLARGESFRQVIFVPARPLRPLTRYELALVEQLENGCRMGQPIAWQTTAAAAEASPKWLGPPEVIDASYVDSGWGAEGFVSIAIARDADSDETRLLVELEAEGGNHSNSGHSNQLMSQILRVEEGVVKLQTGGCVGQFPFQSGQIYRAHLALIDAAGNRTAAPGSPLRFRIPAPKPEPVLLAEVEILGGPSPLEPLVVPVPEVARKARLTGLILLDVGITPEGVVEFVEVRKEMPTEFMIRTTMDAVATLRFPPAGERAVAQIQVTFRIEQPPYNPNWTP